MEDADVMWHGSLFQIWAMVGDSQQPSAKDDQW